MIDIEVSFTDNSAAIKDAKDDAIEAILEAWGNQAVSHAKQNLTAASRINTGALRNSISHLAVPEEKTVYVGTNQEYAVYNEMGTGIYLEGGGGRQTPWHYQDHEGNWHTTRGMKPVHFLRNAVQDHEDEYKRIADHILKSE